MDGADNTNDTQYRVVPRLGKIVTDFMMKVRDSDLDDDGIITQRKRDQRKKKLMTFLDTLSTSDSECSNNSLTSTEQEIADAFADLELDRPNAIAELEIQHAAHKRRKKLQMKRKTVRHPYLQQYPPPRSDLPTKSNGHGTST